MPSGTVLTQNAVILTVWQLICPLYNTVTLQDFEGDKIDQNHQNKIYEILRLSKPFNLTYLSIKSDDLHVDDLVIFGQNICIFQENRNMQSHFNILTFFKIKSHNGQVWRLFLTSIFGRHFDFFWYCSLNHLRCIQHTGCQIFLFLPPNPQFP